MRTLASARLFLCLAFAIVVPGITAQDVLPAEDSSAVIAKVNGQDLTLADLEQKEIGRLLQPRYQYYEAQRKALDELIDQQLLEQEAKRQHLKVDELLKREVDSKVTDPTDDQLRVYYEGLESNEPYESVRGKILDHIRESRQKRTRAEYLTNLRSQAKIIVSLAPPQAPIDLRDASIRGDVGAPVVLVEFADYQCPYCQKIHPDLTKLQQEFGSKLAFAFKDFPLPMHANAQKAAEAARCAGAQGKFWEFHDLLFTDKRFEPAQLKEQARKLSLDGTRFDQCLDSSEQAEAVRRDAAEGRKLGLTGTPSFFVNGHFFSGALCYATLRDLVQQQLARSPSAVRQTAKQESSLH